MVKPRRLLSKPWQTLRKWALPFCDLHQIIPTFKAYTNYWRDWNNYSNIPNAENLLLKDAFPCLHDKTVNTGIDSHYFYQSIWAMQSIHKSGTAEHVDVGSHHLFVGLLSTITKVTFIDLRPLPVGMDNLDCRYGNILDLPYKNESVSSLSCLHVAEHIGLGRYGDPLNPAGTYEACRELSRILEPGGILYFSIPIGKPRTCFNAHRIFNPIQIIDYFDGLDLLEFSAVDDRGEFQSNIDPHQMENSEYACGFYRFQRG